MGYEDCNESTGVVEGERVFIGVDKVCKVCKVYKVVVVRRTLYKLYELSNWFILLK